MASVKIAAAAAVLLHLLLAVAAGAQPHADLVGTGGLAAAAPPVVLHGARLEAPPPAAGAASPPVGLSAGARLEAPLPHAVDMTVGVAPAVGGFGAGADQQQQVALEELAPTATATVPVPEQEVLFSIPDLFPDLPEHLRGLTPFKNLPKVLKPSVIACLKKYVAKCFLLPTPVCLKDALAECGIKILGGGGKKLA